MPDRGRQRPLDDNNAMRYGGLSLNEVTRGDEMVAHDRRKTLRRLDMLPNEATDSAPVQGLGETALRDVYPNLVFTNYLRV